MDVLEAGSPELPGEAGTRRGLRVVAGVVTALLAVAVGVGAVQWWVTAATGPEQLQIIDIEPIGPFSLTEDDLPDDWPRDVVVGALRLRITVTGDPQRSTRADSAGDTGAYVADGAPAVVIPAGDEAEIDVVVMPADCGSLDSPASPLVDGDGTAVPLAPDAARRLAEALGSLCPSGESAPALSTHSVRVDVFFRDRTLVMRARIATLGDRVVLQPRDSVGFRGGSAQEATIEPGAATARLRWLISPAEAEAVESPTVQVRIFDVVGGRAFPWVLDLRVPEGVSAGMAGALRNDGVDLAEVAPRPSG